MCTSPSSLNPAQYRSLVSKVIQSWNRTEPSKPPCSMQSFPATNRRALENGCLTSKAQREYGKQYPVMKQNPKQCTKSQSKASESRNDAVDQKLKAKTSDVITSLFQPQTQPQQPPQAFGIQSKKNKVSMTELLRCIPAELEEESDYPDLSGKKRKGRLPPAKSTKSSRLVQQCREPNPAQKSVDEFKLKKFTRIESKVKAYRSQ